MYDMPVKYFEKNLIFGAKTSECWACYQVMGINYDYLSTDQKMMHLNRITRFIANIGLEAKIHIIPVGQDIKSHYQQLVDSIDKEDPLCSAAKAHAKGTQKYLNEKTKRDGASNDYLVYVLVKLARQYQTADLIEQMIRRPMKTLEMVLGVEQHEILLSEVKAFEETAESWFREQDKRLSLKKTDEEVTQWLILRMFKRGLPEAQLSVRRNRDGSAWSPNKELKVRDGEFAIRPRKRDVLTLTESLIEPGKLADKNIKITHSDGSVSYQTFLTMAHMPDGLLFPGSEWLFVLQDYPVAVEACIHMRLYEHKDSVRKVSGKRREIKSQMEHVRQSDTVPDELYQAEESADGLEAELKKTRDPLVMTSIVFCLAGDDPKQLNDNASFIKDRYEDSNFRIERPMTDQFKLFMQCIPGAGRYVNDYVLPLPPQTLAGSMFAATRALGDHLGAFIGTTGLREHMVFLSMAEACLNNRSASAAILGTLGGGKSFNANLIVYLHILYGASALIFDPKGERSEWVRDIPELSAVTSVITLSNNEEDRGKLDPFIVYRDNLNEAGELAKNIVCELFQIKPKDDEYTALIEAIKIVKEGSKPCMAALVEALKGFSDSDELQTTARRLARRISGIREAGMSKLLFGLGDEEGLNFDKRLNILQIQNLQMPDPTTPKEDYTEEELLSTVLMLPIANFAKRFAMGDRSVFKLIMFDESWALSSTQAGIKIMNFLARMGRSLNAGAIFIGHSVTDLKGDGIKNAITYKFCFKTTEMNEVKRVLAFLDLEETDENIKTITNMPNGQCLFQDLKGRVGKLKFDAVYSHLIKAFNTTPGFRKAE